MLKILDTILSVLPFNGDKTKIGSLATVLATLHVIFPQLDILTFADATFAHLGLGVFAVGVFHKIVKAFVDQADGK